VLRRIVAGRGSTVRNACLTVAVAALVVREPWARPDPAPASPAGGVELRAMGIVQDLAPVADVNVNPRNRSSGCAPSAPTPPWWRG
jgi:hypothetical protein